MDAHHTDDLVFDEGTLHSRECQKIGFEKSTFKISREGDELQFSAVNVSPKYGTLTWQGVIRDGVVEARYAWKKERMFWTIAREQFWPLFGIALSGFFVFGVHRGKVGTWLGNHDSEDPPNDAASR